MLHLFSDKRKKTIWDSWNTQHIARHKITPEVVESVGHNEALILRGQQKNRLVLIGQTQETLMITVILEANGRGKYYPFTAYQQMLTVLHCISA